MSYPIKVWTGSQWEEIGLSGGALAITPPPDISASGAVGSTTVLARADHTHGFDPDTFDLLDTATASATYLTSATADLAYAPLNITASATTSTSYTFALNDAYKLIEFNSASAITAVVPANSSVAFAIGTKIDLLQTGDGQVTASAESGVTVNGFGDANKLSGQWAAASLVKRGTDTWALIGNITA